ncbi:MAG: S-layer homology domain-containing protein [Candidatus Ornithomonoglobus sp.]
MIKYNILKSLTAIAGAAAVTVSGIQAYASVLGTETSDNWKTDMGGGAIYYHNVFDSPSVGKQTENYVEYKPNTEAVPVVVNGASVWGKRTITSAADYMKDNNMRPLIGINADYFSLTTGIPMGYTIIDGQIFSKEAGIQDAVGFRKDGTAFIDKIGIDASLSDGDNKVTVQYINKWSQDGLNGLYMLTDDFADTTHTNYEALFAICTPAHGDLTLNSTMTLTVDEVYIYDGDIAIPDGKVVFVMDPDGNAECVDLVSRLAPGDTVTFANSVYGAERYNWEQAEFAASSIGGRLLNNGIIGSGFEAGAAPRTAVGVKDDGTVVFYTLDGRQSGYSYGAQITTIAKRMQELGCIDALNLDGGGSTAIGAVFPGSEIFTVANRPSDGTLRSCANYLFLRDMRAQTGIPWYVEWREIPNRNFLAGTSVQLEAASVFDTGNYRMDSLTDVNYSAENTDSAQTTVDDEGHITFKGTGQSVIYVTGSSYSASFDFAVYEVPEEIRVTDESNGGGVEALYLEEGTMRNFDLEAAAYVNDVRLEAYPSLFRWELEGTLGTVDEDGTVSLKDDGSTSALLRVTAGGTAAEIPIYVVKKDSFSDISGHWAHDIIESMADSGIINGFEEDGQLLFKPDSNITRIQFAAIMCKALGIDPEEYSAAELDFTDSGDIQPWAASYVKAMVSLGYINGRSDDNGATSYFAPEDNIKRSEAFAVMGRTIAENEETELTYADADSIPLWAEDSFKKLAALNIISGFEDNTIRPENLTTRAEAAALVMKLIEIIN